MQRRRHCYIVTEHVTERVHLRPIAADNLVADRRCRGDRVQGGARAALCAQPRVIHRDIKPSNIMLTLESDVRIIDFGHRVVADSDISRIEGIAGSPSYMSPEQFSRSNSRTGRICIRWAP